MTNSEPRPPHKKNIFSIAADEELIQRARDKAGSGARFHGVIRAFLDLWSSDAYPDLPEEAIAAQMRRAQKIPRKKKKKR
jgi:hypothetical protein